MKKSFIAIIALLTTGIMSAQSKNDLLKEFENLEEKLGEISIKYEKKLQKFQENGNNEAIGDDIKEGDFNDDDFKDFEEYDDAYKDDDNITATMKMFVEMYNENTTNKNTNDSGFEGFEGEKPSAKDKEFMKVMKEYDAETAKIEKKMYEVAKKYIAKK